MKSNGTGLAHKKSSDRELDSADGAAVLIREDMNNIKSDVSELVRHGRDGVVEVASRATDGAKELAEAAKERAVRAKESVDGFVKDRPLTTIAIAAVGGMMLAAIAGRLMKRR